MAHHPEFSIRQAEITDFTPSLAEMIWSEDPALMRLEFLTLQNWIDVAATEWPATGAGNCHDATSLAIQQGQVVGLINAFSTHELEARFGRSETLRTTSYLDQDVLDHIDRLFVDPAENAFYILDIAVHTDTQKTGIGAALIDHAETLARAINHTALALDVSATNPALDFYKRLDFEIVTHTHVAELDQFGISPHLHMVRQIPQ